MQQSKQHSNRFQYNANTRHKSVPGMKIAYGDIAQYVSTAPQAGQPVAIPLQYIHYGAPTQQAQPTTRKGLFGKLREGLYNMVTEEAAPERPIGISQLSRKTFNVRQEVAQQSFFRNGQAIQDYRFNQLIRPGR